MIEVQQEPFTDTLKRNMIVGFARHAKAMTGKSEKFDTIALVANDNKNFAGVIVVEPFWGGLHIKYLYVDDQYRDKGIGSQLMERALKYGQEKDCSFAFVETMSFQALDFYRKLGFELEFTRSGYKHQTSFHYLRKSLTV